jgi:hypothetical protein
VVVFICYEAAAFAKASSHRFGPAAASVQLAEAGALKAPLIMRQTLSCCGFPSAGAVKCESFELPGNSE